MATATTEEIVGLLDGLGPICEAAVSRLSVPAPYYPPAKAYTIRGSRITSGFEPPMVVRAQRERAHASLVTGWQLDVEPFILSKSNELMFLWDDAVHPKFKSRPLQFASVVSKDTARTVAFFLDKKLVENVIDELSKFVHP